MQAFLTLFNGSGFEPELLNSVVDGGIAYELCRPVSLYNMWFARTIAARMSKAMLRCLPILGVVVFLPGGYGLTAPKDAMHFGMFVLALILGCSVLTAMYMILYMAVFYTLSIDGIRMLFISLLDFLTGAIIPLPFFPGKIQRVLEVLPFASMQNVPLRVYSGNLTGADMERAIFLQIFWLIVLIVSGKMIWRRAEKRVVVQGG